MRVTQQPVLRRFWYSTLPLEALRVRPQPFQLLGEKLVLWLDAEGQPAATVDRCCHRTARLSQGQVCNGHIQCPYHGWEFDRQGSCVQVPQLPPEERIPASYRVQSFLAQERYGYVWVCLSDQPLADIPAVPEVEEPQFWRVHTYNERWDCAGLRLMENVFDNAHFSIVHTGTFGDTDDPVPAAFELIELEDGIRTCTTVPVKNNPLQRQNVGIPEERTVRIYEKNWILPFTYRARVAYPNGLVTLIFMSATPIDDTASQITHFFMRNDDPAGVDADAVFRFNRAVAAEDRGILETTNPDVPLNLEAEQHMLADKPGILMRRKLAALIKAHS
ncbi:MAG: aromatic ring-hydroxylating dioxygenase subunit alpha [Cyanobacteriota bacterium]